MSGSSVILREINKQAVKTARLEGIDANLWTDHWIGVATAWRNVLLKDGLTETALAVQDEIDYAKSVYKRI
jgi:hypothetical protein